MKTVTFDENKWQLVPKETTQEMESVYANEYCVYQTAQELHDQMLRASPSHPEVGPLTDAEIESIAKSADVWRLFYSLRIFDFARAILAAAEAKRGV